MPLDPRRLLLLRTVRRMGSVIAAARALHLTPSGVSQHLAKLEAEVGLSLVDREYRGGGRAIRLTPAGQALAEHAERVANALTAAERGMDEYRSTPQGPVRIGGFSVALSELAAPVAMRLATTHPALNPSIYEVPEPQVLRMLADGDLDLVLSERVEGRVFTGSPRIVEVELVRDPFRVVVPDSWPADVDEAALLRRPWITTSYGAATRRTLEEMCREHGLELDAHDIGTGSAPTLLALVANGLGATIIPALTLRQNPSSNVRISNAIADPGSRVLTVLCRDDAPPLVTWLVAELKRFASSELQPAALPRPDAGQVSGRS
ncbi:LysR family transcriptional regulator [Prauserella cavernicola]|uniref:LysR family transcriptional regulator n=1 Tax=Prauserella cavernicola TaxID=2800127 RepID=A0A934QZI8_9PSEU|nr:LysR family transcriptional regulator [Prauserella cavernicola]MBK1789451.1 LysR family transcriptional regulator [Prauserella cavernicola]